jgi:hypothetical protein
MGSKGLLVMAAACLLCGVAMAQPQKQQAFVVGGKLVGGLRTANEGDGQVEFVALGDREAVRIKEGTEPPSHYLYFDVDDRWAADVLKGEAYVVIEYLDAGFGAWRLEYDSSDPSDTVAARYRAASESVGAMVLDTGTWGRAVFRLSDVGFRNRQNYGMDFRLHGPRSAAVSMVTVVDTRPCRWEEFAQWSEARFGMLREQGRPPDSTMELTIGNFEFGAPEEIPGLLQTMAATLPLYRALGVTSDEIYVRWREIEREPGQYSFDRYDAQVEQLTRHGIKWVPFLIAGPAYTVPSWLHGSAQDVGYVCLEHNQRTDIQSLWSPHMPKYVEGFVRAFAEHYRPMGVIESVLLGITGNYGEAIYPASSVDWTANVYGPYHTHSGYWAGDEYARADFRKFLESKYASAEALNRAWGSAYGSWAEVQPFLRDQAASDRAWLDMCEWYIGSMQRWAEFWLATTREAFPQEEIYLCTGGHAPPEHGSDFGLQCKLAAKYGAGVRITNEASDYRLNFSLTRMVASAGKFYGAFYGFEPAGGVDERGVVARIYNAVASGAHQLHYYHGNLFDGEQAMANFAANGTYVREERPLVEIAAYYPQTTIRLRGNEFLARAQELRRYMDFDFVSDQMILDRALRKYKALVFLWGEVTEAPVLEAMRRWVEQGGIIVYPEAIGRLRTVEGDDAVFRALFEGGAGRAAAARWREATYGQGIAYKFSGAGEWLERYCEKTGGLLSESDRLLPITREVLRLQAETPELYLTALADGRLFALNCGDKTAAVRAGSASLTLEPARIGMLELGKGYLKASQRED